MDLVARMLERYVDRPIVNMTDLKASYDLTLEVTPEDYQAMLIRAGIDILPKDVRDILGLDARFDLKNWERRLIVFIGRLSDRIRIPGSPQIQACQRLGLPANYLYR